MLSHIRFSMCSTFYTLKLSKLIALFLSLIICMGLPVVVEPISQLCTAMLRRSFTPKLLGDCILVPIPMNGKDPSTSDSYRAIALAPTLSKAFEWCLLLLE